MRRATFLVVAMVLLGVALAANGPLQIVRFDVVNNNNLLPAANHSLNYVSGRLVVQNTGAVPLHGVRLVVHIQDLNHKDLTTLTHAVGTLSPSGQASWDWYWNNYALIPIDPVAHVVYTNMTARGPRDVGVWAHASAAAYLPPPAPGTTIPPGYGPSPTPQPPNPPGY